MVHCIGCNNPYGYADILNEIVPEKMCTVNNCKHPNDICQHENKCEIIQSEGSDRYISVGKYGAKCYLSEVFPKEIKYIIHNTGHIECKNCAVYCTMGGKLSIFCSDCIPNYDFFRNAYYKNSIPNGRIKRSYGLTERCGDNICIECLLESSRKSICKICGIITSYELIDEYGFAKPPKKLPINFGSYILFNKIHEIIYNKSRGITYCIPEDNYNIFNFYF